MKKIFQYCRSKEYQYYIIIILIAFIICTPLTVKGWYITHDGFSHLSRNYETVEAIKQGQVPIAVVSNFCKGFGYSWNLFYPPLSTYIGAIFKLIVPTYVEAIKLTIVLAVITSGLAMFQLMKKITTNAKMSLITAIIYITATYFISNIYVRRGNGRNYGIHVFSNIAEWII